MTLYNNEIIGIARESINLEALEPIRNHNADQFSQLFIVPDCGEPILHSLAARRKWRQTNQELSEAQSKYLLEYAIEECGYLKYIDQIDKNNATALTKALGSQRIGIWNKRGADYLISNGADIDHWNEYGVTKLMIAAYYSDLDTVDYLCSKRAYIGMKSLRHAKNALDFILCRIEGREVALTDTEIILKMLNEDKKLTVILVDQLYELGFCFMDSNRKYIPSYKLDAYALEKYLKNGPVSIYHQFDTRITHKDWMDATMTQLGAR